MKQFNKHLFITFAFFLIVITYFFRPLVFLGKLPVPTDTLVGLYHPYRDYFEKEYQRGYPFKNFLITDPIRQQIPWRKISIDSLANRELPLWNPYQLGGMPLLANLQSASLYPLNILFVFLPFYQAWSILIVFEPLLAGLFMYGYIKNLGVKKEAALMSAICFSFSGFFLSWLTWGTILHVALWLPLILLCVDKLFDEKNSKKWWIVLFIFSLSSSFLAGHLQTFFYSVSVVVAYIILKWLHREKKLQNLSFILAGFIGTFIITSLQWFPTIQLVLLSARDIDQDWQKPGWFIPWQHFIQFIVPDFFGNPATLNYTGVWNYGELLGYIGIIGLCFAILAVVTLRRKLVFFYIGILLLSIIFSTENFLGKLPFELRIPFFATAQPTRLIFLIDFSLAVLAGFGLNRFVEDISSIQKRKNLIKIFGLILCVILFLYIGIFSYSRLNNLEIAIRNTIIPFSIFMLFSFLLVLLFFKKVLEKKMFVVYLFLLLTAFDVTYIAQKFTPFTSQVLFYPNTRIFEFLANQPPPFRILAVDDRIMPPNVSAYYHIESVSGYDPLYLRNIGELLIANERKKPDFSPPFGFNRILTPKEYNTTIINLLNVKYILSLNDITSPNLKKVFQEGQTRIYENTNYLPRFFFVQNVNSVSSKQKAMEALFDPTFNPKTTAIVEASEKHFVESCSICTITILGYGPNKIHLQTQNPTDGFLVIGNVWYPSWRASIDGKETKIEKTDFALSGIYIPQGTHDIILYVTLL